VETVISLKIYKNWIAGAAIGAIAGSAVTGAAGGAIFAIPAGFWKGYEANEDFKRAFKTCMLQRGHTLVN
jgi:hypothetical protein